MKGFGIIALATAFLVSSIYAQEIFPIERELPLVPERPVYHRFEKELSNGLVKRIYEIPGPRHSSTPHRSQKEDDDQARKVLRDAGVEFTHPDSKISFDVRSWEIEAHLSSNDHILLENYMSSISIGAPKNINIRVEVFELPTLSALAVLENCQKFSNHTTEREAVYQLTKKEGAKLKSFASLITRSGNRSSLKCERTPRLSISLDPVLGADNYTVDISYTISISKDDDSIFNQSSLSTGTDGFYKLIASCDSEKSDFTYLIFLKPTVFKAQ